MSYKQENPEVLMGPIMGRFVDVAFLVEPVHDIQKDGTHEYAYLFTPEKARELAERLISIADAVEAGDK